LFPLPTDGIGSRPALARKRYGKKKRGRSLSFPLERRTLFRLVLFLRFQGAGAVDWRCNRAPSESPARQSGFLGSSVVISVAALPAPVVALSTSPPPLRWDGDGPQPSFLTGPTDSFIACAAAPFGCSVPMPAHRRRSLKVVSAPLSGPVVTAAPGLLRSNDRTIDYICGNCRAVLLYADEGRMHNLVFCCAKCGCYNSTDSCIHSPLPAN
jgi:hypothetical protein